MTDTSNSLVTLAVDAGVATITLDSPHNRNALSSALVTQLKDRLQAAKGDTSVRAVVLTHTGTTFCAGADLTEASGGSMSDGATQLLHLLRLIIDQPQPVIAHLKGHVRAGGLGLVGACDMVVAGPESTFAFTESRLGLAPAIISLTVLPRLTNRAASRYFLTGEKFDAATAAEIGLVTDVGEDAEAGLAAILDALRKASPQGLRETKRLTTAGVRRTLTDGGGAMTELSSWLFGSEEAREGMLSFLERRPPRWAPSQEESA
ncbi:enoyl-CoA hydratase family protein [Luteipulveratus mongoliensis]|uniref:Enoyl-CoA hydratase n=1 Tax=Luteipulveratus mongoliensis TaxID=571913 RepID=A0A0K1JFM6_9MICO|nr:enoyl-CoA hydratase family protein [Luteipulveratus mongoliensis]AKU15395.1 enoyl-CoA hydratase [Luteipulveratus mongoliensis]